MPATAVLDSTSPAAPSYGQRTFSQTTYHPPPPPPVIAHHVWILDCKHCGMFLTNRGMKAVLLLRPNVSLYSSDALPINCSPYATRQAEYPRLSATPSSSSRTCDCLTQSLHCHGCGQTVGYMIVVPCMRCTSSISASNRTTNGHRFVFHSTEVTGTHRHYIANEPGVVQIDTVAFGFPIATPYPLISTNGSADHEATNYYLPTPPLELASDDSEPSSPELSPTLELSPSMEFEVGFEMNRSYPRVGSGSSISSSESLRSLDTMSFTTPSEIKELYRPPVLKDGDTLFWHHLVRSGEIPGVIEDERSRTPVRKADAVATLRPVTSGR